jgi:hypothetical protein
MFSLAFFSLTFLKPVYKVLGAESCSDGDTQQPATVAVAANQNPPSKPHQKTFHQSPLLPPTILLQQVFYIQW